MGSSDFTSRNKSHISTGGGRELQGGKDEGLKKWEMLRCRDVCSQEGREKENEEREGLEERDKGAKKGWEIRKVGVIYSPPLVTHWAPLRYSIVTV